MLLKKRDFKKLTKGYQELLGFNKVMKEDSYQILGVGKGKILFKIEEEDTESTANHRYGARIPIQNLICTKIEKHIDIGVNSNGILML